MVEQNFTPASRNLTEDQGLELYRVIQTDLERERVLNTKLVRLNPEGTADRFSLNIIRRLVSEEYDPQRPRYMLNAVNNLSGENLVGIANAHFSKKQDSTQTEDLTGLANRIRSIGSRARTKDSNPPTSESKDAIVMDYVYQEIAERLAHVDLEGENRRPLIESIDTSMTRAMLEDIFRHQPDLERELIGSINEFSNQALRSILRDRAGAMDKEESDIDYSPEDDEGI